MNPPFLLVFFIRVRKQGRGLLCSRSIKGGPSLTHTPSPSGQPAKALTAFAKCEKPSRAASKASRKQTQHHRSAATMIPHESFKQSSNILKNITCRCESGEQHTHRLRSHMADSTQSWQTSSQNHLPGMSSAAANSLQQSSSTAQLPSGVLIPDTNQLTWGVDRIPPAD